MAIIYDLYIDAGATFSQQFDLAGDQTGFTIRSSIKDSTGAIIANTASWTNQSLGELELSIDDAITATMSSGIGYFDIELEEDSSGIVNRIIKGRVYVDKEVTA